MIAAPVTIRTRLYRRKRGCVALYSVCMLGVVFAVTLGELGHDAWFGVALVLLASMLWAWHGSVPGCAARAAAATSVTSVCMR